ncbi:MAG TPA: hypothetical protein PLP33_14830 [Leptospiraceae bacterium]|nr:hypothetical protein [Leptospiraceae bacterium]
MYKKGHFWKNYSVEELDSLAATIFNDYRSKGFPDYVLTENEKFKEYEKLYSFCQRAELISDGSVITQTMHGLALCWSYFPHWSEIKCGNMKTPKETFLNDDLFKKVIAKRLKYGTYITDGGILKSLKTHSGTQSVSGFRPSAAYAVYNRYCKENSVVWDMSGGFGGRMLGASVCSKVKKYIFTEPSTKTYKGLTGLSFDLRNLFKSELIVEGYCCGSEEFVPDEEIDLAFTSPPYFNTELYSAEESQSCVKYPTKDLWLKNFLGSTINNVKKVLKKDGKMIINIKNVKNFSNLEESTVSIAENLGFSLEENLSLSLSSMIGNKSKLGKFKYEPVFVFRKY